MSSHSMVRRSSMRKSVTSTPNTLEVEITPRRRNQKHTPPSISCVVKSDSSAKKLVFVIGDFLSNPSRNQTSANEDYYQQVYSDDSDISCSSTDSTHIENLRRKAEELKNTLAILEEKKKIKKGRLSNEDAPYLPAIPQSSKTRGRPKKKISQSKNISREISKFNETPVVKRGRGRPRKIQPPPIISHVETNNSSGDESVSDSEARPTTSSRRNLRESDAANDSDDNGFVRHRTDAEACLHGPTRLSNYDSDIQLKALDFSNNPENVLKENIPQKAVSGTNKNKKICNEQIADTDVYSSQELFLSSQEPEITRLQENQLDNEQPIPDCVWESQPNFNTQDLLDNRISLSEADVNAIFTDMVDKNGVDPNLIQQLNGSHEEPEPIQVVVDNDGADQINHPLTNESNPSCELEKDAILLHKKFRRKSSSNQRESSTDSDSDNNISPQKKKFRKKRNDSINKGLITATSNSKTEKEMADDVNYKSLSEDNDDNVRQSVGNLLFLPNELSKEEIHSSPKKDISCGSENNVTNESPCKLVSCIDINESPSIRLDKEKLVQNNETEKNKDSETHQISSQRMSNNNQNLKTGSPKNRKSSESSSSHKSPRISLSCKSAENSSSSNDEMPSLRTVQAKRHHRISPPPSSSFDSEAVNGISNEIQSVNITNDRILCPAPTSPLRPVKEPSLDGGYSSNVSSQIDEKNSQNNQPLPLAQNELESLTNMAEKITTSKATEKTSTSSEAYSSSFFKSSKLIKTSQTTPQKTDTGHEDVTNKTSEEVEVSRGINAETVSAKNCSSEEFSSDEEFLPSLHTLRKLRKKIVQMPEKEDKMSVGSKSPSSFSNTAVENNIPKGNKDSDSDDLSSSDEEVRHFPPKVVQQVDLASNFNSDDGDDSEDEDGNEQSSTRSKKRKKRSKNGSVSEDDAASVQVLSCEQRLRTNNYTSDSSSEDDSDVSIKNIPSQASTSSKKGDQNTETIKKKFTKVSSSDDSLSDDDNHITKNALTSLKEKNSEDCSNMSSDLSTVINHRSRTDFNDDSEIVPTNQTGLVQNNDSSDFSSDNDDNNHKYNKKPPRVVKSYDITSDNEQSIKSNVTSSDENSDYNGGKRQNETFQETPQTKTKHYISPDDSSSSDDDGPCNGENSKTSPDDVKSETDDEKHDENASNRNYNFINDTKEEDSIDIYTDDKELNESGVWVSLTQDNNIESNWFQRRLDIEENSLVENKIVDDPTNSTKKKSKKYKEKKDNEIDVVEEEDSTLQATPKSKEKKSVRGTKKNDVPPILESSEVEISPKNRRKSSKYAKNNTNVEEDSTKTTIDETEVQNNSVSKKKAKRGAKNDSFSNNSLEVDDIDIKEDQNNSVSKKKSKNDSRNDEMENQTESISKKKHKKKSLNEMNLDEIDSDEVVEEVLNGSLSKKKKKKLKNKNDSLTSNSFDEINDEINKSLSKKKKKVSLTNNVSQEGDMGDIEELDSSVSKKKKKKNRKSINSLDEESSHAPQDIPLKKALKRKRDNESMHDDSISDRPMKKKKKKAHNVSLQDEHTPVSISHLPSHFLKDLASVKPHSSVRKLEQKKEKRKKKLKFIEKNYLNGNDFIPLETSSSTRFGVVPLNTSSYGSQTDKGDFKQNMLFGNDIRRTNSQKLKALNMKRKVKVR